jgi:N-acetylmuramoyl-L-alanine amidase
MRSKTRFKVPLRRAGTASLVLLSLVLWQRAGERAWAQAAPPAKGAACDRAAFRVVVDVGHTADAPGARSARGALEYDFNLRLATLIERKLVETGFEKTILLVTDGPKRKSLTDRVARANHSSADLFLSIHHDSVPDSFLEKWEFEGEEHTFSDRFPGHSIFVSVDNADFPGSLEFGRLLGLALKARGLRYTPHYTERFMGHRQRLLVDAEAGVYRYDQLIVLKNTRMPAVLLEAGSIINRDEELQLGSPERQSLIAAAAAAAVESFCASRHPRTPHQAARRPAAAPAAKTALQPAAAAMSPAKR